MASRLNPYLNFDGTAREAMEFYRSVFGGELVVNTFDEFGEADATLADKTMHAQLEAPNGFVLMASDTMPDMPLIAGTDVSISLSGDDADELRGYWNKLTDGGTVTMPLEKQMWGDEFGMCTDRFGTRWLVNIAGVQA